jgi:hypothetical protein
VRHQLLDKLKHFTHANLSQLHGIASLLDDAAYHDIPSATARDLAEISELEQACLRLVTGLQRLTGRTPISLIDPHTVTAPTTSSATVSIPNVFSVFNEEIYACWCHYQNQFRHMESMPAKRLLPPSPERKQRRKISHADR